MFGTNQSCLEKLELALKREAMLKREIQRLNNKLEKKKGRKHISHKSGFKKVSKEEAQEMLELWNAHIDLVDIANKFGRSQTTVSRHIRRLTEEQNEQVERMARSEDRTSKE
jgi:DNA-binding MarR family transcriptional regulator